MTFLLELKDDLVLISTWNDEAWHCWGSFHKYAFSPCAESGRYAAWYAELIENGKVTVKATFSYTNMQLPPDNLS